MHRQMDTLTFLTCDMNLFKHFPLNMAIQILLVLFLTDGKHVRIRKPDNAGSVYFNYKNFHSIILLAVVDGDGKFLFVDIGCPGRGGDSSVFKNTDLYPAFENDAAGVPDAAPLPGDRVPIPYYFIGDGAFPMCNYMLTPYSRAQLGTEVNRPGESRKRRLFNYRHSRARRMVESTFGTLNSR